MKKFSYLIVASLFLNCGLAMAQTVDPCVGPNFVKNSWLIDVNQNNLSTREGLLETLDLLATGGFSVSQIFSYAPEISQAKTIFTSYDPTYWSFDEAKANQVKEETLKKLIAISGNKINCNEISKPLSVQ